MTRAFSLLTFLRRQPLAARAVREEQAPLLTKRAFTKKPPEPRPLVKTRAFEKAPGLRSLP